MINVNSVMNSLYTTISSNSTLVNSDVKTCMNDVFNTDGNMTPWVGVYFNGVTIDPHRIGSSTPWRATYDIRIFAQDMSFDNAQDANDKLDRLMWPLMSAVNSNKNLDGTVHILTNLAVEPFGRNLDDEQWLFTNEIILNYITDV